MRVAGIIVVALVTLGAVPGGGGARAAARLEVRGGGLPRREVESLAAPALRAPGDSTALAALLGTVVARLQELGHLEARAQAVWDEGRAVLRLETSEGPLFRLRSVTIEAPDRPDSAAFAAELTRRAGDPASPGAAGLAGERALRAVADEGYPYARLSLSRFDVDTAGAASGAAPGVALGYAGTRGPRVVISALRVDGLKVTRPGVATRSLGRLAGRPWDRAAALAARERLAQLGLFRNVTFEGIEGEADWSRARLVYRVEEPRYNRFEAIAGFQGDAGTAGLARIELGNLLGTGRSAALRWESRGRGRSDFEARYAEPLLLGAPLRLEGVMQQQIQDSLYARTRWGAHARFTLGAQERLELGWEQERVVQERGELERAEIQSTLFALERSTLDDPLAPRRGTRTRLDAAQSFKREILRPSGERTSRASAAELHGEWHRPFGRAAGLSLELAGAGRLSSQRLLPVFERYVVGGAASLRGHDEEAFRVDRFALSRLEWRWFLGPGGQRVFLFWDHAVMGTRLALPPGGDRIDVRQGDGAGFGLRLETAGGMVGVDYGLEPGRPALEGKIHLQLVSTF
jgi:outer membrane protein assembly factor BamA